MTRFGRALMVGGAGVVVFDTVGSFASRALGFEYSLLGVISLIIYGLVGGYVARVEPISRGVLAGMIVGLVDATLGWWVSWVIGPGRLQSGSDGPVFIVIGAVFAVLVATGAGALGAWIAGRKRPSAPAA